MDQPFYAQQVSGINKMADSDTLFYVTHTVEAGRGSIQHTSCLKMLHLPSPFYAHINLWFEVDATPSTLRYLPTRECRAET